MKSPFVGRCACSQLDCSWSPRPPLLYSDTNAHRGNASSLQGLLGTYLLNDVSEEPHFGWGTLGFVCPAVDRLSQSVKRVGAMRWLAPGVREWSSSSAPK